MDILFITSSRIGDAVLSTGLLDTIAEQWPKARVTIVCGPLTVSLFEGYPCLKQIIALKKQKHNLHWLKLWKDVRGNRWDMVIDLRNSVVSRLIPAQKRFIHKGRSEPKIHKAVQNSAVMGLPEPAAPRLWFTPEQQRRALALIPEGRPVLGIGPTANWIGKTWPEDRFIEVIRFMTEPGGVMAGARVAIFAAPGEEEVARSVLSAIPAERALDVIAKTDPATAAAALARCDFYIGNDSGLMHCAAAAGIATLGLFGPSWPEIYAPFGPHCRIVACPKNFDELIDFEGYDPKTLDHSLMVGLSVDSVKNAILAHPYFSKATG